MRDVTPYVGVTWASKIRWRSKVEWDVRLHLLVAIDLYRALVELAWSRALKVLISNSVGILYFHPFRDIILLILK
jgi:hypothetical protein